MPRAIRILKWTPQHLFGLAVVVAIIGCGEGRLASAPTLARTNGSAARLAGDEHGRRKTPFRILMIGNSLTESNHLPSLIEQISIAAQDDPPIEVEAVTYGGYSLGDHLVQGDAARAIARGGWDVVVLQQGPSTLPESRVDLIDSAIAFSLLIRAVNAEPALYGVWPEQARMYAFDDGIESYRLAADVIDGALFPVALTWKTAWARDASLPFYSGDRFHPSQLGTYAAALVIYTGVRGKSPVGLPFVFTVDGFPFEVDVTQGRVVQEVVEEMTATKRRPGQPWLWPKHSN